ncbi:MAG: LD-carboxypeptidase [Rickettsiales bacterium]|jgi:muramoyltetrapeptide carboxypeptidase LdcA involved in peptidoglycan recycling|nr:LD-carboxypeptidase [Rickettsiales bacterium]
MRYVKVIAPSGSIAKLDKSDLVLAEEFYKKFDVEVLYSEHIGEIDEFYSSSIASRIEDLHGAFAEKNIGFIQIAAGGSNINQLLPKIDFDLIKNNIKPIVGHSDATALLNAIYAQTNYMSYHGLHYKNLTNEVDLLFIEQWLKRFLDGTNEWVNVLPSDFWWEKNLPRQKNEGFWALQDGEARGIIVGGNLPTLSLLQGTKYMPNLENKILFLEYDGLVGEFVPEEFDRDLESLLQQQGTDKIQAIVFGRFTSNSTMDREKLIRILHSKSIAKNIPMVANVDFGHTKPMIIFPIGGECSLSVYEQNIDLKIKLFNN